MNDVKFPLTIKAEPAINTLMAIRHDANALSVLFKGSFQRNYLNDIDQIQLTKNTGDSSEKLEVTLNRDSIYDKLPEGFFHEIDRFVKLNNSGYEEASFKEEYEKQRNEIIHSRKFFQPFDQQLFELSLTIEQLFTAHTNDPFNTLYGLFFGEESDFNLAKEYRGEILQFLPFLSAVKGDMKSIKLILSYVCDAEVEIVQEEFLNTYQLTHDFNILNRSKLGIDLYCGKEFTDFVFRWSINIHIAESKLYQFHEDRKFNQTLEFIIKHLIPADIDTVVLLKPFTASTIEFQSSNTKEKLQYLGINTIL